MRTDLVRGRKLRLRGEARDRSRFIVGTVRFAAATGPAASIIMSSSASPAVRGVAWVVTGYAVARATFLPSQRTVAATDAVVASAAVAAMDAVVASAAIAMTGTLSSPFLVLGIATASLAGYGSNAGMGALAGTLVVAASVPHLAGQAGGGMAAINHIATWTLLFPLSGIAAGLSARVWKSSRDPQPSAQQERRRIARDLHDGVAQTLAHLRLELDMLAHPEFTSASDPDDMARLARVAERTLSDVRAIIRDLAAAPAAGGLAAELSAYVRDLQTSRGPAILFSAAADIPADHPAGAQLFRIAQEAISNAVRHSGARQVLVALAPMPGGSLRLAVEDDGSGIPDGAGRPGGLGLSAMRERAVALGGRCEITVRPEGGTRVLVETAPTLMRIA